MKEITVSDRQARIILHALEIAQPHPCGHPDCKSITCTNNRLEREDHQQIMGLLVEVPEPYPRPGELFTCTDCGQEDNKVAAWRDVDNKLYCYGCYTS